MKYPRIYNSCPQILQISLGRVHNTWFIVHSQQLRKNPHGFALHNTYECGI